FSRDWSSDVCSSDLAGRSFRRRSQVERREILEVIVFPPVDENPVAVARIRLERRAPEHDAMIVPGRGSLGLSPARAAVFADHLEDRQSVAQGTGSAR